MAELEFDVVDVFTSTPFSGNPLAVVHGARALSTQQLQALAREFNLSETAFPMPPDDDEAARGVSYRLRIFTPLAELPFAGHPSVGTAWLLARRGLLRPGRVVQACGAGELPLQVAADGGPVTLTGGEPTLGGGLDAAALAGAVGLAGSDLADVPSGVAGTGAPFGFLFVRPEALDRAAPLGPPAGGVGGLYVVAWPRDPAREPVHARLFAPALGIPEDPATGSAALALAVHAVAAGLLPGEGRSGFTVRQGLAMGRPSTLEVGVDARSGRAVHTTVRGSAVRVASGRIAVPAEVG